MGKWFFDRKSYEKALRAYERAVALEADNTAFQLNRSNALKWLGKHQVKNGV